MHLTIHLLEKDNACTTDFQRGSTIGELKDHLENSGVRSITSGSKPRLFTETNIEMEDKETLGSYFPNDKEGAISIRLSRYCFDITFIILVLVIVVIPKLSDGYCSFPIILLS